ncbi:MAG: hypothetical protein GC161_02110 [Planctomycetaceae bacterium]|nr:hypothetical protein [Planctomycetaceae bacterium]
MPPSKPATPAQTPAPRSDPRPAPGKAAGPAAGSAPKAPPAPPPPPPLDLRPGIRYAARLFAVALGALAATVSLIAGAPLHIASGRGLLAWVLVLALGVLVRAFALSTPGASAEEPPRP